MFNFKNKKVFFWGVLSVVLFCAVDFDLFGLFGGFEWPAVMLTMLAYAVVFIFLVSFVIYVIKVSFNFRKLDKNILYQYIFVIILSIFVFIWLDNRDPFPNSSYSDVFSK